MSHARLQPLSLLAALLAGAVLTLGFTTQGRRERFAEIDVERINLIEPDGSIRMVLASSARSPRVLHRGVPFGRLEGGRPGIIFYNDEGTESGGLTFSGRTEDGRTVSVGSLTFDQYERDQAVALQTVEAGGTRRSGLSIMDYPGPPTIELARQWDSIQAMPEGPQRQAARRRFQDIAGGRPRLYVGRSRDDGTALVSMSDGSGRERLRLRVDSLGTASIEFLNASGQVVRRFSPD